MQQHSALNFKICLGLAALVWISILSAACDLWNLHCEKSERFGQNM